MKGMEFVKKLSKEKRYAILAAMIWGLAWTVPWGGVLSFQGHVGLVFLVDMIKLGVAMLLFLLPGVLLYVILSDEVDLGGIIPVGISFSVLLISLIGLAGRVVGFSFVFAKVFFACVGFFEIIFLMFSKKTTVLSKQKIVAFFRKDLKNISLGFALLLAVLLLFHDQLFFVDDYTYLAYLTNWQHADPLGFKNIVHEMDVREFPRYWLALLPMSQALLADLSGISGLLLLGNYLELYLVPFAILSLYWLARFLGVSQQKAGLSVLFQISLYAWMIHEFVPTGYWFYLNMSEDKVFATFLIFPSLLFFSLRYIKKGEGQNLFLLSLAGMAMVFTHPVIFVFSVFIILLIGLIMLFIKDFHWKGIFLLSGSFALMMLPHFLIRLYLRSLETLSINATSVKESFEAYKVVRVVSDVFYGLAPDTLLLIDIDIPNKIGYGIVQIFRYSPVIIVLLAMIIAFSKIREELLYLYVFSSVFLTVFATLPYTGWILGYLVSGRMITRASWFLPLGIGIVLIWQELEVLLKRKKSPLYRNKVLLSGISLSFLLISPIFFIGISERFSSYFESIVYYKELSQVGAYIDENTDSPVMAIALDYKDTQLLPGVSANARVISFRERKLDNPHNHSLSVEEIQARIYASNTLRDLNPERSSEEYCGFVEEFDLDFVLVDYENAALFQTKVENCERKFSVAYQANRFLLFNSNNPK